MRVQNTIELLRQKDPDAQVGLDVVRPLQLDLRDCTDLLCNDCSREGGFRGRADSTSTAAAEPMEPVLFATELRLSRNLEGRALEGEHAGRVLAKEALEGLQDLAAGRVLDEADLERVLWVGHWSA